MDNLCHGVGVEEAQNKQGNKGQSNAFEKWFGGLMWPDPYPSYEEIARRAWEASALHNQTNDHD
jgi:hypothetical protein